MSTDKECREEFEAKCKFMRVEWSLEWDKAGFYSQPETDRAYTWFKLGFDQAKADQSNLATIAGVESSVGHLSVLVDDLRGLLARAMQNFRTLHDSAMPDNGPDMDAIIPAAAFAKFVDEDSALRYAIKHSAQDGMLPAPAQSTPCTH